MIDLSANNNNIFNINFLKCIDALASLAETQNVGKTAIDLRVSTSTITRLIKKLEFVLKTQLVITHGAKGVSLTENGKLLTELYNNNIKATISQIISTSRKENQQTLRIACHQLAAVPYVFPAIQQLQNKAPHISININPVDKEIALHQLFNKDVDIIIYPMSEKEITKIDKQKYEVRKCREYKPALYLNKNHPLANTKTEELTIEDFDNANMVPINKNARLSFFRTVVNDKNLYNFPSTNTLDLHMIYEGLLRNFWCYGGGNEFERLFDCNAFAKKTYQNMNFSFTKYFWYIINAKETHETKQVVEIITNYCEETKDKTC